MYPEGVNFRRLHRCSKQAVEYFLTVAPRRKTLKYELLSSGCCAHGVPPRQGGYRGAKYRLAGGSLRKCIHELGGELGMLRQLNRKRLDEAVIVADRINVWRTRS